MAGSTFRLRVDIAVLAETVQEIAALWRGGAGLPSALCDRIAALCAGTAPDMIDYDPDFGERALIIHVVPGPELDIVLALLRAYRALDTTAMA